MTPPQHPSISRLAPLLLLAACGSPGGHSSGGDRPPAQSVSLELGATLVVTRDTIVEAGSYELEPRGADGRRGVIRLEGARDVVLDLTGVDLRGTPAGTDLDQNTGFGIVLVGCENVVVRGGRIGGYKGCVVVKDSQLVTLEGMQFDGWYGARLRSTPAAEDEADWLWPHDNDRGEWLDKYGAAISITNSSQVMVRRCRGRHGQNGVLLTRVEGAQIYDNDFSFMSGWGLALYRSSRNVISHNVFDYCVRGYSHGVYWRGQDSAGILMFERCCDNILAYNSATHGGDGVFLFAGQDLVDGRALARGEARPGGSDRNVFWRNDLRFAVANALEATFSSHNVVIGNDLSGCHQHGVWGGYSNNMVIVDNKVHDTRGGAVTIEHGQDCVIARNDFTGNEMAVELYWDPDPHLVVDSSFGQHEDTSSSGHWVLENVFQGNDQDLVLKESQELTLHGNRYAASGGRLFTADLTSSEQEDLDIETLRGWLSGSDGSQPSGHVSDTSLRPWNKVRPAQLLAALRHAPPQVPGLQETSAETRGEFKGGLETIVMGEWGPWDFRAGEPRPIARRPGGVLAAATWDARWFQWDKDTHEPRGHLAAWRALADEPLVRRTVENWVDPWGDDEVRRRVGIAYFGLVAETTVDVDAGSYRLTVTSDDGVRVLLDGVELDAVTDWTWHATKRDDVLLQLDGEHTLTLEYFQIDGASALTLELERER
jgi:nitrous oxidase accessory protein NosD